MPLARLGPYEIKALLGTGQSGEVYKATDTRLNRTVAIKVLRGPDIDRLEREARLIAALNNPHICSIYDIGDNYIVMEYIEGTQIKGPLPPNLSLHFATQIATALEAAHSQGIIHRDLKPENILVTRGNVKLLDFGHAKQLSSSPADAEVVTLAGIVLGTAAYMSPEQAQGKPVDPRSDVFSFGLVLYEMLSGRRAFTGDTVLDVLNNIVKNEPRALETTPEFQRIVLHCLRKDPASRFQSMAEVKEALAQIPTQQVSEKHPSIAVLPFANLSSDKENEYFSDGLTDEIINALAQIPGLRVTARTSAFVFRNKEQDIRRIAETLDVQTILEGSVRKSGKRLRITAQLINAVDGCHLWSKKYDKEMADVFAIQDDIAVSIVKALQLRLYHGSTVNIPAYEAYLKARYYMWKLTPTALEQSRECYEEAIALDPTFALAFSGYADYLLVRALIGLVPASDAMPAARVSARRALDIDPSLPEAHALLATVATLYDFNRQEAEREFALAMKRESVSSVVRLYHALYYLLPRAAKQAVRELERGLQDDPLNATLHLVLGVCLLEAGNKLEASREFQEALELDQQSIQPMVMLAMDYWSRNMNAEALAWAERAHSLTPGHSMASGLFAGLLALNGDSTRAKIVIETLGDTQSYRASIGLALYHTIINEIDKAIYWIEQAVQHGDISGVFILLHSPLGKTLSSSPSWPTLAKSLRLHETIVPASAGTAG
jgi:serine/threonine-protein kinase